MTQDCPDLFRPLTVLVITHFQFSSLRYKRYTLNWNQWACPSWCHGMHYSCKWAGDVRVRSSGMFYWSTLIYAERRSLYCRGVSCVDQYPVVPSSDISVWQKVKNVFFYCGFVKETRTSSEKRGRRKVWRVREESSLFYIWLVTWLVIIF